MPTNDEKTAMAKAIAAAYNKHPSRLGSRRKKVRFRGSRAALLKAADVAARCGLSAEEYVDALYAEFGDLPPVSLAANAKYANGVRRRARTRTMAPGAAAARDAAPARTGYRRTRKLPVYADPRGPDEVVDYDDVVGVMLDGVREFFARATGTPEATPENVLLFLDALCPVPELARAVVGFGDELVRSKFGVHIGRLCVNGRLSDAWRRRGFDVDAMKQWYEDEYGE